MERKKVLMVIGMAVLLVSLSSGLRVNEIEMNPEGTDSGNEWVELYSGNEVSLVGWELENNDRDVVFLDMIFRGYLVIDFAKQWLDNLNEGVLLRRPDGVVFDESPLFNDSRNDGRSWQYCDGGWVFLNSTKGSGNFCDEDGDGVFDDYDLCPGTESGEDVDGDGCSNPQFCRRQSVCGPGCDLADWKGNEFGVDYPGDCMTVFVVKSGEYYPICAGSECGD